MGQQIPPVMQMTASISQPVIIGDYNAGANGQTGPLAPLPNPDPIAYNYNLKGFGYLPAIVPESDYRNLVGEFIFEYVEKLVGEARAP
jgi:hypothetical protein